MTIQQQNRINGFVIIACLLVTQTAWGNPLGIYLEKPEPKYSWQATRILHEPWGAIGYYELISQHWRGHLDASFNHRQARFNPQS